MVGVSVSVPNYFGLLMQQLPNSMDSTSVLLHTDGSIVLIGGDLAVKPFRLLVTGSRDWGLVQTPTGPELIHDEITFLNRIINHFVLECWKIEQPLIIVHGKCKTGADDFAAQYADMLKKFNCNVNQEPHPADWNTHGRRAGFVRNKYMVDLGADACIAFIKNNSRGSSMCANLAEESGIPTYRYRSPF